MSVDWSPLRTELARWRAEKLHLPLWWRDDDAIRHTPALDTMLKMAAELALPVHLAVIPKDATDDLVMICNQKTSVVPIVHGWAHKNHAPEGSKKAEFGQPRDTALPQSAAALSRMKVLFGEGLLPMFVPPWNRIDPTIMAGLAAQGFVALSTFTPRTARRINGLVHINTHIDPIAWKTGGGLVEPDTLIAGMVTQLQDRRMGRSDAAEPLGFLTHHLVHDAAIWAFTNACLSELLAGGATPVNLLNIRDDLP